MTEQQTTGYQQGLRDAAALADVIRQMPPPAPFGWCWHIAGLVIVNAILACHSEAEADA